MRSRIQSSTLAALTALVVFAVVARAQDVSPHPTAPVCLGFAFGAFSPKLDWAKAGHAPLRRGSTVQAPDGRDWASDQSLPNDTSLYLFPAWWPVGVWVELATRTPAPGDTVNGRATALVARGDITPPVARVRAWRVPCERPAPVAPSRPAPDSASQRTRPRS